MQFTSLQETSNYSSSVHNNSAWLQQTAELGTVSLAAERYESLCGHAVVQEHNTGHAEFGFHRIIITTYEHSKLIKFRIYALYNLPRTSNYSSSSGKIILPDYLMGRRLAPARELVVKSQLFKKCLALEMDNTGSNKSLHNIMSLMGQE